MKKETLRCVFIVLSFMGIVTIANQVCADEIVETDTKLYNEENPELGETNKNLSVYSFSLHGSGYTPLVMDIMDMPYSYNQRNKAKKIILERLVIYYKTANNAVYINHCEDYKDGCKERVDKLVDMIFRASKNADVDPWLVLSMAVFETSFNPFESGSAGNGGIMGMIPARHPKVSFFHNEDYRKECYQKVDACQREVVELAIQILKSGIEKCDNDVNRALRYYKSKTCNNNYRYSRRVLRLRRELLQEAEKIEDVEWCNPPRPICDSPIENNDPIDGLGLDL